MNSEFITQVNSLLKPFFQLNPSQLLPIQINSLSSLNCCAVLFTKFLASLKPTKSKPAAITIKLININSE